MTTRSKVEDAPHRRAVLSGALLGAALASASPRAAMATAPVSVGLSVVDRETGAVLPFWRRDGRPFIAGQPGRRYGLRVANRTGGRVLVVLSVDGVNVLSGETAGFGQRGYVLDPYESYDVNGWRKSTTEVAAFTFAALSGSYAARTGRPGDVGVIGMAVFREREAPPPVFEDAAPRSSLRDRRAPPPPPALAIPPVRAPVQQSEAPPAPAARAPSMDRAAGEVARAHAPRPDEKLGTAHGAREWSSITTVEFDRASASPQLVRRIEYDTPAHLLARGVTPPYPASRPPRAFPLQPGAGFVPDPPGEG